MEKYTKENKRVDKYRTETETVHVNLMFPMFLGKENRIKNTDK